MARRKRHEGRGTITVILSDFGRWSGTYRLTEGGAEVEMDFFGSGLPVMKVEGLVERRTEEDGGVFGEFEYRPMCRSGRSWGRVGVCGPWVQEFGGVS